MRILLLRLRGVSPVTERDEKQYVKDVPEREMDGKLTTSDTIALAALIGCLLVLSHAMPIVYDNQRGNDVD